MTRREKGISKIPPEASEALSILRTCFGTSLLGVYLHGSAVTGGLRPNSDVDLLAIVDRPTTHMDRERLLAALLMVSGCYPVGEAERRPLELIVFNHADLATFAHPGRSEFVYGEWLRGAFEAGEMPEPASDPELTLLLAQARDEAIALAGPEPADLLPVVPKADIRCAIGDTLSTLLGALEGDERNVLLTLARMWRTLVEGDFVTKDAAARWALPHLPLETAKILDSAREDYLNRTGFDWPAHRREVGRAVEELAERVAALLR